MRITNKSFFSQYLSSHDGETVHRLLTIIHFLIKKKTLQLFLQLPPEDLTDDMKEIVAMVRVLQKSYKLNRQSVAALIRVAENAYHIQPALVVKASKHIDSESLSSLIASHSNTAPAITETDALSLFVQKGGQIYKRGLHSDIQKLIQ